jgi:RNA polymerase sigma-70 factor, ECF subfamily
VGDTQEQRYLEAAATFGAALQRLASAYEADRERQRDLQQELHLALWRSMEAFDERCSLRTWVYRVAHNAATSYVIRQKRGRVSAFVSLEEAGWMADPADGQDAAGRRHTLEQLMEMIQQLKPLDRQVMVCYLEGLDAVATAEVTGLSAGNIATKIHRIKQVLADRFHGGRNAQ